METLNTKEKFIGIYKTCIKREGADDLLKWLESTDFFVAPASTKFHCAYEGGLCEHSVNVYEQLKNLIANEKNFEASDETVAICGLLHDVCKAEYYKTELRNVKENGEWVKQPYYFVDEKIPYGHGEKSVYIINGFLKLTRDEAMAINWHMGGFDDRVKGGSQSLGYAYSKCPLAPLLHVADLLSTYINENRKIN